MASSSRRRILAVAAAAAASSLLFFASPDGWPKTFVVVVEASSRGEGGGGYYGGGRRGPRDDEDDESDFRRRYDEGGRGSRPSSNRGYDRRRDEPGGDDERSGGRLGDSFGERVPWDGERGGRRGEEEEEDEGGFFFGGRRRRSGRRRQKEASSSAASASPPPPSGANFGRDGRGGPGAWGGTGGDGAPPPPPPPPPPTSSVGGPGPQGGFGAGVGGPPIGAPGDVGERREPPATPIHYKFHRTDMDSPRRQDYGDREEGEDGEGIPRTSLEGELYPPRRRRDDDDEGSPEFASPRRDAVARYYSTKRGAALATASAGALGMALGGFVGKSTTKNDPRPIAIAFGTIFVLATFFRGPYGELARASGLALIFAIRRFRTVRKRYPTFPHVKACLKAGPRVPFPPLPMEEGGRENPWRYVQEREGDPKFGMTKAVAAMGFAGGVCGGSLPVIPSWMGGLGGAGLMAYFATMRSARGDLVRTMGMRLASLVEETLDVNRELGVVRKAGVVSGRILDKLLVLDRKHRVKDRVGSMLRWTYDRLSGAAERVRADMEDRRGGEAEGESGYRGETRGGDERGEEFGPRR